METSTGRGSQLPRRYKCKYEGCGKAFTKVSTCPLNVKAIVETMYPFVSSACVCIETSFPLLLLSSLPSLPTYVPTTVLQLSPTRSYPYW